MGERIEKLMSRRWSRILLRGGMGLLVAGYVLWLMFMHFRVSRLVTTPCETPFGTLILRDWSVPAGIAGFVLLAAVVFRQYRKGARRDITLFYWFVYLVLVGFTYVFLMVHPVEIAHYPQFGLLAVMIGFLLDPKRNEFRYGSVLSFTVLVGILDELLQHLYHRQMRTYFDFNDTWMNVVAAGGGVLLYYGFRSPPFWESKPLRGVIRSPGSRLVLLFTAVLLLLAFDGRFFIHTPENIPPGGLAEVEGRTAIFLEREPGVYGSWQKTFHTGTFYVIPPSWGVFVIAFTYLFFAVFDPRYLHRWGFVRLWRRRPLFLKQIAADT